MKKLILLILLTNSLLIINAQSVFNNDSTYLGTPDANGQIVFTLQNVGVFTYNSQCQLIADTGFVFINDKKTPNSYESVDYYPNGKVFNIISKNWDAKTNTYYNSQRTTYTYNSNKLVLSTLTEIWNETDWLNSTLVSETYDGNDSLTDNLSQTWDTTLNKWVNQNEDIYTYSNGLRESRIAIDYIKNSRILYTYTDGLLTIDIEQALHNGQWQDSLRTTYTYDENRRLDTTLSETYQQQQWQYLSRDITTYDATGYIDTTLGEIYQQQQWQDRSRTIIQHNTNNSIILSLTELYATMQWIKESSTMFTYNADGTTKETLYEFFSGTIIEIATKVDWHYVECNTTLPLSLLDFNVSKQRFDAALSWQTAGEINTDYFNIQRSTDGKTFTAIGKVMALRNSNLQKNYAYTDGNVTSLNAPTLYYRLAETDKDGTISYSNIVHLDFLPNRLSVVISPNPFRSFVTINSSVNMNNMVITIFDINGKKLYRSSENLMVGNPTQINTDGLNSGIYILTIQLKNNEQVFKIVK